MMIDLQNDLLSARLAGNPIPPVEASRLEAPRGDLSSGVAEPGDQAQLSSAASLATQAAALPDVRMDKVAAVKDALASGYQVSSTDVANAMIDQMLGRSK